MMMTNSKQNKPRPARSLTTTLAIAFFTLIAAILVVNGSLALFTNIQSNQNAISNKQQFIAQDAARIVAGFIEQKFSGMETAVELANPVNASAESQKNIMENLLSHDPAFRQFALLDSHGEQLAQTSRTSQTLSSQFIAQLKGDAFIQTSKGQRYISPVYIDDTTSEPLIAIAVPAKNVFGDFQGTLAAEVNLKFMWDLVDQLKVGQTGYAYVVDNQGNLIAFGDTSRVLRGENLKQIIEVKEFIQNPSASTDISPEVANYIGILGKSVVGAYVPLGAPESAVVTELPTDEAYQPVIGFIGVYITTLLVFAGLAGLMGVFMARRLTVPLVKLTETATRIAGGETGLQTTVSGSREVVSLAMAFNSMTAQLRDLIGSLEQRVTERTIKLQESTMQLEKRAKEFEAISEISNSLAAIRDLDNLLPLATRLVSERLNFYHTGIFILDDSGEYAVLKASSSEGGQRMLERQHRLKVEPSSLVGTVALRGVARIALDTEQDTLHLKNPDLPETKSEVALPLLAGTQIIGVLDVQSTQPKAFSEDEVYILNTLANQVAISIQNSRSYGETRRALAESEKIYQQFVQQGWKRISKESPNLGYRYSQEGTVPLNTFGKAFITKTTLLDPGVSDANPEAQPTFLVIPIKIRNLTIGSLQVRSIDSSREWDQDEIAMIQAAAERAALALENARLLEDSQRRATKERVISDIAAKITGSISMDNILKTAAEELGQAIPSAEVVIQFQSPETEP